MTSTTCNMPSWIIKHFSNSRHVTLNMSECTVSIFTWQMEVVNFLEYINTSALYFTCTVQYFIIIPLAIFIITCIELNGNWKVWSSGLLLFRYDFSFLRKEFYSKCITKPLSCSPHSCQGESYITTEETVVCDTKFLYEHSTQLSSTKSFFFNNKKWIPCCTPNSTTLFLFNLSTHWPESHDHNSQNT